METVVITKVMTTIFAVSEASALHCEILVVGVVLMVLEYDPCSVSSGIMALPCSLTISLRSLAHPSTDPLERPTVPLLSMAAVGASDALARRASVDSFHP